MSLTNDEFSTHETSGTLIAGIVREAGLDADMVEGFILGDRALFEVASDIADMQEESVTQQHLQTVLLRHAVTGSRLSFYDTDGKIDSDKVQSMRLASDAGIEGMPVVGWFVARCDSSDSSSTTINSRHNLEPSLRDAAVHRGLNEDKAGRNDGQPIVLLMISISLGDGASTQSVQYRCLRQPEMDSRRFTSLPLRIRNLTHDSLSEYKSFTSVPGGGSISPLSLGTCQESIHTCMHNIESSFDNSMRSLDSELEELKRIETQVVKLSAENAYLRSLLCTTEVSVEPSSENDTDQECQEDKSEELLMGD